MGLRICLPFRGSLVENIQYKTRLSKMRHYFESLRALMIQSLWLGHINLLNMRFLWERAACVCVCVVSLKEMASCLQWGHLLPQSVYDLLLWNTHKAKSVHTNSKKIRQVHTTVFQWTCTAASHLCLNTFNTFFRAHSEMQTVYQLPPLPFIVIYQGLGCKNTAVKSCH